MRRYKGNVKVDIREFEKLEKSLKKMQETEIDKFIKESAQTLADEFLKRVRERTPVGKYNGKVEFTTRDGKFVSFESKKQPTVGGTLRRGWKIGKIEKTENDYEVNISNEVKYGIYVENGHVIRNKKGGKAKGWVDGTFMLRNTEIEMAFVTPEILEKKMEKFLRGLFNEK